MLSWKYDTGHVSLNLGHVKQFYNAHGTQQTRQRAIDVLSELNMVFNVTNYSE